MGGVGTGFPKLHSRWGITKEIDHSCGNTVFNTGNLVQEINHNLIKLIQQLVIFILVLNRPGVAGAVLQISLLFNL